MLKFELDKLSEVYESIFSLSNIKVNYDKRDIVKHNSLENISRLIAVADNLIMLINSKKPMISQHIQLETMRMCIYKELGKSFTNSISSVAKRDFDKYFSAIRKISNNNLIGLNISKNETVNFIYNVTCALVDYFKSEIEYNLGNKQPHIINEMKVNTIYNLSKDFKVSVSDLNKPNFNDLHLVLQKNELADSIISASFDLISATPENSKYKDIINNVFLQDGVPRWGGRLTLNNFNLLQHTSRVTFLVDFFLQSNKKELNFTKERELNCFRYAFYHDYPESILNDLPSPIKQENPELKKILIESEKIIMKDLELIESKTAKFICKMADIYDCLHEAKKEIQSGNQDPEFKVVIDGYVENFTNKINDFTIPQVINKGDQLAVILDKFFKHI